MLQPDLQAGKPASAAGMLLRPGVRNMMRVPVSK
jgi:hypothetical protein